MITYILTGIILGFTAGVSPGPLLVLVISESLTYGTRAGIKTAMAPVFTDTPIIILSLFVVNKLQVFQGVLSVFSMAGAFYIFSLAYEGWKSNELDLTIKENSSRGLQKGVYTNMLSPHPYIFWITVGTPLILKAAKINYLTAVLFIVMFYIFILGSKTAIALFVGRFRDRFNSCYILIQRVLSIVLAVFACFFFYEGIKFFIY